MALETENQISKTIIGCAIDVHNELGPGLLEKVYEECLFYLLHKEGMDVQRQVSLPVLFRDIELDAGFRLDLLVNDLVVIELKSSEKMLPIHEAQLYTYLKLSNKKLGLLLNFNSKLMKDGIKRMVM